MQGSSGGMAEVGVKAVPCPLSITGGASCLDRLQMGWTPQGACLVIRGQLPGTISLHAGKMWN